MQRQPQQGKDGLVDLVVVDLHTVTLPRHDRRFRGLRRMLTKELPKLSRKSKLAETIRYALTRRDSLERFVLDGRVELDSNTVERAIRPQTITRKNSLFAGSDGGGRTWATIASLLATAKMNNVDPHAWLTQTLERIANGWPNREIEVLMPWNYRP